VSSRAQIQLTSVSPRGFFLSHHRAYGSVHGGSIRLSKGDKKRGKSEGVESGIGDRDLHRFGGAGLPRVWAGARRLCGQVFSDSVLTQFCKAHASRFLLFPDQTS
jgi:hypothetical protein